MSDEQSSTPPAAPQTPGTSGRRFLDPAVVAGMRELLRHQQAVTGRPRQIYSGTLLGVCLVFLAAYLAVPSLDVPLQVALFAFVIAIPLFVLALFPVTFEYTPGLSKAGETVTTAIPLAGWVAEFSGTLAVIIGISAVVGHLNGWAVLVGYAAFVVGGVACIEAARISMRAEKKREQKEQIAH